MRALTSAHYRGRHPTVGAVSATRNARLVSRYVAEDSNLERSHEALEGFMTTGSLHITAMTCPTSRV